jgi:pyruvate-formate lyase-activating enzyme
MSRPLGALEFMRSMDLFQKRLYEHLLHIYGNEPFCRLLALKLCNLAVGKYHFLNRHSVLLSKPFQLTVDPANACQLECPGCVHSANKEYAGRFEWPRSTLPVHVYDDFLAHTGAWAFCAVLYNYGEPLLNKRFAEIVRASKKHLLFTMTSTNLSMPLDDPDSIVASGLDRMVLSIDGTTQETYEKYRRRGKLDLIFENVRKLVASRKRLGSPTPYLIWQFLTFEHNAHQVTDAIRKAQEMGLNEILIQTPFEVTGDDPAIRAIAVRDRGVHRFVPWDGNWCTAESRRAVGDLSAEIRVRFEHSWEQRFHETPGMGENSRRNGPTCDWLYHNVTMDGAGRIMACCMAPDRTDKHLVFANFTDSDIVNSPMAKLARLSFADRHVRSSRNERSGKVLSVLRKLQGGSTALWSGERRRRHSRH